MFAIAMVWHFGCLAQNKMDLAKINFTEEIGKVLKGIPNIQEGKLQGREDMISYGFDNDGSFTFAGVVPGHIEVLSWKGNLVGYAFKIKTFAEQQKVIDYFKDSYRKASFQSSKFMDLYQYKDDGVHAELRAVIAEKFKEGAKGYLDVKKADFAKEFERMTQRY